MSRVAGSKFATKRDVAVVQVQLDTGDHPYGKPELVVETSAVINTNITVGPAPTYVGAVQYDIGGPITFDAPGKYRSTISVKVRTTSVSTRAWWDVWVSGVPSPAGPAAFAVGKDGTDDTKTFVVVFTIPPEAVGAPFTFALMIARADGSGTVTWVVGDIIVERVE